MEWSYLFIFEMYKHYDYHDPIEHVTQHGTESCGICPPQYRVEHAPCLIGLRITAFEVPHIPADVVRPWSITACVIDICTKHLVEGVFLESPDTSTEEAGTDEEDQIRHHDEEYC